MFNSKMYKKDNIGITHTDRDSEKGYREILKELEIEKPDDEPLTKEELRKVFVYMQEDLCIGS